MVQQAAYTLDQAGCLICTRALPRKAELTNLSLQVVEQEGRVSASHLARELPGRGTYSVDHLLCSTHMLPIWRAGPRMTLGVQ